MQGGMRGVEIEPSDELVEIGKSSDGLVDLIMGLVRNKFSSSQPSLCP